MASGALIVSTSAAGLVAPAVALASPQAGTYSPDQSSALIRGYWDQLPSRQLAAGFEDTAVQVGRSIGASRSTVDRFLRMVGDAISSAAAAIAVAHPFLYDAVLIGAAVVREGVRFLVPQMSQTEAFPVLDATFKASSWLGYNWARGRARKVAQWDPYTIPIGPAERDEWRFAGIPLDGLSHPTAMGRLFISEQVYTDEEIGASGRYVGVSDTYGQKQMFIIDGLA
jgi:hypothetical protein